MKTAALGIGAMPETYSTRPSYKDKFCPIKAKKIMKDIVDPVLVEEKYQGRSAVSQHNLDIAESVRNALKDEFTSRFKIMVQVVIGEKQGQGSLTHKDCVYEGEFYNGLFNGAGKMTFANGDVFDGNWKDGLKHGKGELRQKNGKTYKGLYKNGEKYGEGIMVWPDRRRYEGKWKNGKMHGMGNYSFFDKNKGRLRTGISEWNEGTRVRWVSPSRENIDS